MQHERKTTVSETKRMCYYIPPDQDPGEDGYIPSVVTEGEPGHAPLKGNGMLAQPWRWGSTLQEAQAICAVQNAKMGVSPDDALEIVISSMRS
jgi:hypothetical protein